MKKKFLLLIYSVLFISCHEDVKKTNLTADITFNTYPDSSFFLDIRYMQFQNDQLYLGDYSRKDITVTDANFSSMYSIGESGIGPKELNTLSSFYVLNDTIYIYDFMVGIKTFNKAHYLNTFYLPKERAMPEGCNFFVHNKNYYVPYITDTSTVIKLDDKHADIYFGKPTDFPSKTQKLIRNDNSLLLVKNRFYTISNNLPIIQEYDLNTLDLISTFEFSNHPFMKKVLQFVNSQKKVEQSYYKIIPYACQDSGYLYLLCASWEDQYQLNHLLEIALEPTMRITNLYQLPGNYYTSFCVTPKYIFAFNSHNATIERIKLNKYE